MLIEKISEIEKCLDHNLYFPALALSLTIPDVCSKITYDKETSREIYEKWFNEYVNSFCSYMFDKEYRFTGEDCYRLRCEYLHHGTCKPKDKKGNSNYTRFVLTESEYNSQGIFTYPRFKGMPIEREMTISIKDLCLSICNAAERLYNSLEDKTVFDDPHYEFRAQW